MKINTPGVYFEKTNSAELKAYRVWYSDGYMAAHFNGELFYAKTPGKALGSWMRRHHEHDYMEMKKAVRMHRDPDADFLVARTDHSFAGKLVSEIYHAMTTDQKMSILQFGGINLRYAVSDLSRQDADRQRKIHSALNLSLDPESGSVSGPGQTWLFDDFQTKLIEEFSLPHFPDWRVQKLNSMGISVFILVIQKLLSSSGEYLTPDFLCRLEWQLPDPNLFNMNITSLTPRFFHKIFSESALDSLAAQPCYIYSQEHGCYWRDTSGYSQSSEKCRVFSLGDALNLVSHCGNEKAIYIQFSTSRVWPTDSTSA